MSTNKESRMSEKKETSNMDNLDEEYDYKDDDIFVVIDENMGEGDAHIPNEVISVFTDIGKDAAILYVVLRKYNEWGPRQPFDIALKHMYTEACLSREDGRKAFQRLMDLKLVKLFSDVTHSVHNVQPDFHELCKQFPLEGEGVTST
jgi:hypothetical protein